MVHRGISTRQAHNLKVVSSNLAPATNKPLKSRNDFEGFPFGDCYKSKLGHGKTGISVHKLANKSVVENGS
jgi:hypothetical protein